MDKKTGTQVECPALMHVATKVYLLACSTLVVAFAYSRCSVYPESLRHISPHGPAQVLIPKDVVGAVIGKVRAHNRNLNDNMLHTSHVHSCGYDSDDRIVLAHETLPH